MALKTTLETLDGVDDALKSLYVERDGTFVLDIEGVDNHHEVANLKSAYERLKADLVTAKRERDTAKTELAAANKGKPDAEALATERQGYLDTIATLTTERDDARGKLTGVTRDQSLTSALNAAGIAHPTFIKAASALLRDQIKTGDDGKLFVEGAMGPKPLADFVKGWAAGDEGKAFVTPAAGGGARPENHGGGQKELKDMDGNERLELRKAGKLPTRQSA